jgi:hypothetical protein
VGEMMGIFAQAASAVIVLLGIPCGMIVGWIAKEELGEGNALFLLIEEAIFGLVFFFLLYYYNLPLLGVLAGICAFASFSRFKRLQRPYIVYAIFLVILLFTGFYIVESSLMFIYGIPCGSMIYAKYKKQIGRMFRIK